MRLLQPKKINYTDIQMIATLLLSENAKIFIFDPDGKVNWDTELNECETCTEYILFNFGGKLMQYKEFALADFDCIVDFSQTIQSPEFKTEKLNLIQSPAGVGRYLYPSTDRKFHFLDFIQTPTLRSKIMKRGLKLMVQLNQINRIGKRLNVLSKVPLRFHELLKNENYHDYAIFLGTPGFWRKPVIQLVKNNTVVRYVKIATSAPTRYLVRKENWNLKRIKAYRLNQFKIPQIFSSERLPVLVQKSFDTDRTKRINKMNEALFLAQKELMLKSMKYEQMGETPFYTEILDLLDILKNQKTLQFQKLYFNLKEIKKSLNQKQYLTTSAAHGDFTPWNILQDKTKFFVYDWEMAVFGAPAFYDAFHFIYQSEILVNRKGIQGVEKELERFFKSPRVADFVKRFNVDVDLHHHLYLLHTISKNLVLLCRQEQLSADHELLLKNWELALSAFPFTPSVENARISFLKDLQDFLMSKNYAAMKFYLEDFTALPVRSDLDLAIDQESLNASAVFIANHPFVARHTAVKKSFMTTCHLHFVDGAFLSIDFIHDFIRKGKRYLDAKAVLTNARIQNGVKLPALFHDIEYAQHFYTLNNSGIPLNYQQIFMRSLQANVQADLYLDTIMRKYEIQYDNLTDAFAFTPEKKKRIQKYTHKKYGLGGFVLLRKKVCYMLDFLVDLKQNKGFIVTFSGVDGAGKTTIINAVKKRFEEQYRKEVVLLRHRPGILPILSAIKYGGAKKAEAKASVTLPRQGSNKSKISSLVRFSYYFADYFFGQIYIYFKYVLRGKVVIYDRYYFDFINDARRSNISLNRSFIKRLFAFIYKPDFNFYLYNDPEVILKRKQELSRVDITELNAKYSSLFEELKTRKRGTYHRIKNDIKADTIATIFSTIIKVA